MTYALLVTSINTIGKDKIVGFAMDNNRRAVRRERDNIVESFDDRFTLDPALECLVLLDRDPAGIPFKTYTHVENIQGIFAVEDPLHAGALDKRYCIG
jgi:hypothetical protein